MAAKQKTRSYDEYVNGSGPDDTGLSGRLADAWRLAPDPEWTAKNEGKEVDRISILVEAENRHSKRTVWTREVSIRQRVEDVCKVIRDALESDPGPSYEGSIRTYMSVAGRTSLRLGSYQRAVSTGVVNPDGLDEDMQARALPAWAVREIFVPLLQTNQALAAENARMMHEGAVMVQAGGTALRSIGEGVGAVVGAVRRELDGGGVMDIVGKIMGGAAKAGIPGAAPGAAAVSTVQEIRAPLRDRPSLLPPRADPIPGTVEGPADTGASHATERGSLDISAQTRPPLTRHDVEQWAAENPDEAEEMVKDKLRAKGFPV